MGRDFGDERTFGKMLAGTRFKPWLKKYTEGGKEVVRKFEWYPEKGSGSWVLATPDEIADGEFFATSDDFYRANGVPDHQRNAFWKQAA